MTTPEYQSDCNHDVKEQEKMQDKSAIYFDYSEFFLDIYILNCEK